MSETLTFAPSLTSTTTKHVRVGRDERATSRWSIHPQLAYPNRIPNETTLAAIEELNRGGGHEFSSIAELMADLDEDD